MSELDAWKNINDVSQELIINALRARVQLLEEALTPFAKLSTVVLSDDGENLTIAPHYWVVIGHPNKSDFTKEDIEKAKAVIYNEVG